MKTLLWFETFILMNLYFIIAIPLTIVRFIFRRIKGYLELTTDTCDFYADRGLHLYQPTKALAQYNKEKEEANKNARNTRSGGTIS